MPPQDPINQQPNVNEPVSNPTPAPKPVEVSPPPNPSEPVTLQPGQQVTPPITAVPPAESQVPPTSPAASDGYADLPPADANFMPPRKSHKWLIIIIILVVLIAAGAAIWWYMDYLNNKPEKVLSDALTNTMTNVLNRTPFTSLSDLTVNSKIEDQPFTAKLHLDNKQANNDTENTATVDFQSGNINVSLTGSLITIDTNTAYIKLDNLTKTSQQLFASSPDLRPTIKQLDPLIKKIDGQWIKFDLSSVSQATGAQSAQADACSKAVDNLKISKADQPNIGKLYSQYPFIDVTKVYPAEVVAGVKSFHYEIGLNTDKAVAFSKAAIELPSFADVKASCKLDGSKIDQAYQDYKDQQKGANQQVKPTVQLWISQKTRLPNKVMVDVNDTNLTAALSSVLQINAPNVQISAPPNSIPYSDVQKQFQGSSLNTLRSSGVPLP